MDYSLLVGVHFKEPSAPDGKSVLIVYLSTLKYDKLVEECD